MLIDFNTTPSYIYTSGEIIPNLYNIHIKLQTKATKYLQSAIHYCDIGEGEYAWE